MDNPSRRAVLTVTAMTPALAVTGCSAIPKPKPPRPGPDVALLQKAISDESALLSRYDATLAVHAGLSGLLTPIREHHAAHLAALQASLRPGNLTPSPHPTHTPTPTPSVPTDKRAAVAALRTAELRATSDRGADVRTAIPSLAQLFASIGVCEARHAIGLAGAS